MSIRVFVIEDHTIVRQGLIALLESAEDVEVIGYATDGFLAIEQLTALKPDIAVCDLGLPGIGGIEVMERLRESEVRFIVLSMYHDAIWVQRAVEAGAWGYLVKGSGVQDLIKAIRCVASGVRFLSPSTERSLNQTDLSQREREILALLAQGHTNKEMSQILFISARTVENHRAKLMNKLGIFDAPSLTRYAIRHGYVDLNLK